MTHIPEGYHSVTPSLTVKDAAAAIDFYVKGLGATELFRMPEPNSNRIMHAEIRIGNSTVMLSSEYPDWGALAPEVGKGGLFMIYVPDCDQAYATALQSGATSLQDPADQFWGDRTARIADPHGYRWTFAQKVRDVSPEEIQKAANEWAQGE